MDNKTFILGLGAPKSGTTWLYRYIESQPNSSMGVRKEYRIWPSRFADGPSRKKFNFYRLLQFKHGILPTLDYGHFVRMNMIFRDGFYERYFAKLVRGDATMTGDISPGYMKLNAAQLSHIADRLKSVGFRVKVVFLMRDPVERSWSGARMRKRHQNEDFLKLSDSDAVKVLANEPTHVKLTRYDQTLDAIDAAFDPSDVFLGIFEELFSKPELKRLSDFLEIPADYEAANKKVNVTQKDGHLDDAILSEMKALYAPVYEACNARFPQTLELWH